MQSPMQKDHTPGCKPSQEQKYEPHTTKNLIAVIELRQVLDWARNEVINTLICKNSSFVDSLAAILLQ